MGWNVVKQRICKDFFAESSCDSTPPSGRENKCFSSTPRLNRKALRRWQGLVFSPLGPRKKTCLISNFCLRSDALLVRCWEMSQREVAQWDRPVFQDLATSKVLWMFINQTCATFKNIPAWGHLRNCVTGLTKTVTQLIGAKVNFNFSRHRGKSKVTCWIKRAFSMDAVKTSPIMINLRRISHPHTQESAT